jgi:hypothetical protein
MLGLGGAWFRSQVERAKKRCLAIAQIETLGGRVLGSGESAHPRPNWLLKLDRALGDYGEATAVIVPKSTAAENAERIARLFPEAVIWREDKIVHWPHNSMPQQ